MDKQEWLNHPYTEKLENILLDAIEAYEKAWSSGQLIGEDYQVTAQATLVASGKTRAYHEIVEQMHNIDSENTEEE